MSALVALDREQVRALSPEAQRQMVGQLIEQGRDMLARALAASDINGIIAAKGAAATVTEMTRQLGLSKEARLDAEELVRRSEFALGKAIRAGQESGTISRGQGSRTELTDDISKFATPSVEDIEPAFYANGSQMARLSDGVEPEQFEEALAVARGGKNVSRANVVREVEKVRPQPKAEPKPAQPKQRRRPLPDQARTAGWELRKSVERLQRIAADDRFDTHKDAMAPQMRSHLTNAVEVCQDLLNRINNQEGA